MVARRVISLSRALVTLTVLSVMPVIASAHHGWGGYSSKEFELSGVVEQTVTLAGAHAAMKIKVGTQVWDLTLAPPLRVTQSGLTETTIPVGATVTIHGHRSNNPKRFEVKTERVTYNGKTYNVYPDRE